MTFRPAHSTVFITLMFLTLAFRAEAINKCSVEGKPVFQDAPCSASLETVGQLVARKLVEEQYYLTLDKLQSRGQGMIEARVYVRPTQDTQPATNEDDYFKVQRGTAASRSEAITARLNSQTAVSNANSASRLTAILEDAKQKCGGSLDEKPSLGMNEKRFRECTLSTRFGNVTQVVAHRLDEKELRLFILPSGGFTRVYMIDGIVTKMK
jgi:hypothetical protein